MKVGTKSLLFGVHQFLWHPLTVFWAWRKLYGTWPNWWQCISIVFHDVGYWGKPNIDGPEGREHPIVGARLAAKIAGWLHRYELHPSGPEDSWPNDQFCAHVYFETLFHSRELATWFKEAPSALCWADKYCACVEPGWFYLFRARCSGEVAEFMRNAKPIEDDLMLLSLFTLGFSEAAEEYWFDWYRAKVRNLPEVKKHLAKPNCFVPTL